MIFMFLKSVGEKTLFQAMFMYDPIFLNTFFLNKLFRIYLKIFNASWSYCKIKTKNCKYFNTVLNYITV